MASPPPCCRRRGPLAGHRLPGRRPGRPERRPSNAAACVPRAGRAGELRRPDRSSSRPRWSTSRPASASSVAAINPVRRHAVRGPVRPVGRAAASRAARRQRARRSRSARASSSRPTAMSSPTTTSIRPRRQRGVESITVTMPDGTEYPAKLIGRDAASDLAVLKINAKDLPFVKFGDSPQRARRRLGDRDRQSVRPRRHGDRGHRLGGPSQHRRRAAPMTATSRPTPRSTAATRAARCST